MNNVSKVSSDVFSTMNNLEQKPTLNKGMHYGHIRKRGIRAPRKSAGDLTGRDMSFTPITYRKF